MLNGCFVPFVATAEEAAALLLVEGAPKREHIKVD